MNVNMRGVFPIITTPFQNTGDLDETGLRNIIRFCLRAGSHGVVTPVNSSEFYSLTDEERRQVVEITVNEVAGKVPVIAGVAGTSLEHAAYHAKYAVAAGADSLIAFPPYVKKASPDEIVQYYQVIDEIAGGRPVWIQNDMPPLGTQMSPELIARIVNATNSTHYVKEECVPAGHNITKIRSLTGNKLKAVHGGKGAIYIMDEYARGLDGTMPACAVIDLYVDLWNMLEGGDMEGANRLFNTMPPFISMASLHVVCLHKEVLYRRGIIENTYARTGGGIPLDEYDRKRLKVILADIQPLFKL